MHKFYAEPSEQGTVWQCSVMETGQKKLKTHIGSVPR